MEMDDDRVRVLSMDTSDIPTICRNMISSSLVAELD